VPDAEIIVLKIRFSGTPVAVTAAIACRAGRQDKDGDAVA